MKAVSIFETGCVRKNNEDNLLIMSEVNLFAVADGMGGHNAGELASKLAIEELNIRSAALLNTNDEDIQEWMSQAMTAANNLVYEVASNSLETEGMGTTLTALVLKGAKAVIGHIGDSRIYLWRDNVLSQLSEDHSMVNELVRLGQLTEEKARDHPHKNVLSRALGVEKSVNIDCFQIRVQDDDVFILCTDGFSNMIEDEEMVTEFSSSGSWEQHLYNLRMNVLERGAPDNFTVICSVLGQ